MSILKEFLLFLFGARPRTVYINSAQIENNDNGNADFSSTVKNRAEVVKLDTKDKIVFYISIVLGIVLFVSLLTILYLSISSKPIPPILRDIFFTTLGYYGGAFISFIKVK